MARLTADLMPGKSGSDFTAEFKGRHNAVALERATEITIYGGTAAAEIEVTDDDEGTTWYELGTAISADGITHISSPPVCRGIRVAGEAAASPAPVKVLVRHGM